MSASFNGTSSNITLPSGFLNYEYTQPFSFAARVYLNVTRSGAVRGYSLLSRMESTGNLAGIEIGALWTTTSFTPNNSSVLNVYLINVFGGVGYIQVCGSTDLQNNTWYSVCVTYSGSGVASGVKMYINGVRETEGVNKDSLASSSILNSITPRIGSRNGAASTWFSGDVMDAGVWDVELSASEAAALGKGAITKKIRPQSLVLSMPMIRELMDEKGNALTAASMSVGAGQPRIYL